MPNLFDLAQKMARGELPPPPVAQLVGFQLVAHAASTCMVLRGEKAQGR